MVVMSDGCTVNVRCGQENAQEYQVENTPDGTSERSTCFIEAREGDTFTIRVSNLPSHKGTRVFVKLMIDGKEADGLGICDAIHSDIVFEGYPTRASEGNLTLRAFTFGKMATTSEGSAKKLPNNELDGACTIRVEVSRYKRIGDNNHTIQDRTYTLPTPSVLHEDSKPALYGLNAVAGETIVRGRRNVCNCNIISDSDYVTKVVVFTYMPGSLLVAKGIKTNPHSQDDNSDDDDDGEVVVDDHRTERVASLRRAREARGPLMRNQRIKRESTVKSEATVKEEEDTNRELEVVDLTADGEYVPPSRQVGETIVLGDDDDDDDEDDY